VCEDLRNRVAEKISHPGEFLGVEFVFRPSRVHGTDFEPCEADRLLVAQAIQFDHSAAAGDRHVQVVKAFAAILPDQVAQSVQADIPVAARVGDPGGVLAGVDQGHPIVELVLDLLDSVAWA
jgi:hypothetical protein